MKNTKLAITVLATLLVIIAAGCATAPAADPVETLLVIEPNERQTRNSEGDLVRLKDGRLCLVYSRFTGGTRDHSTADLAMRTSKDNLNLFINSLDWNDCQGYLS